MEPKKSINKLLIGIIVIILLFICGAVTLGLAGTYFWYSSEPVAPTTEASQAQINPNEASQPPANPTEPAPQATLPENTPTAIPSATIFTDDSLSFAYDPLLFGNFSVENIPAAFGGDLPAWEQLPQYKKIPFGTYPLADTFHQPVISIFPVSEYISVDANANERITALNQMLRDRNAGNLSHLPFFPGWNAAQIMASRVEFINFKNGSGIRYITQYGQDIFPINNHDMFYTFQGLTSDNAFLVTAIMPISNPVLPDPETVMQSQDFTSNYQKYLEDTIALINSQTPESFTPNLNALDALFSSLQVTQQ